jgi:hypothetical protein
MAKLQFKPVTCPMEPSQRGSVPPGRLVTTWLAFGMVNATLILPVRVELRCEYQSGPGGVTSTVTRTLTGTRPAVQESFTFEWEPVSEAEEWRAVIGWEGLYEVSSLGRVRSLDRQVEIDMTYGSTVKRTVRHYRGRMLRQHVGPGTRGYP